MNPKIRKVTEDIDKTRAKIAELEALLPELERKKTDLENTEIIRMVRSLSVAPGELADFIKAYKSSGVAVPSVSITGQEESHYDEE